MKFEVIVSAIILLLPSFVIAQDCMDYCDYLHCTGWVDTPFISSDVAVNGAYAYIADGNASLPIVDISNPDDPVRIGEFSVAGSASGIIVVNGYAYVAAGNAGVTVLSLDDPSAPAVVGVVAMPASISGLNSVGNLILAVGGEGLYVIDISEPQAPLLRGSLPLAGAQDAVGADHLVCVVTDSLHLVDIADPDAPTALATLSVPESPHSAALQGQYAYIACGGAWDSGSLQVVDVSDPEHPTITGAAVGHWAEGIAVVGDHAYLCGLVPSTWHGRFDVFDISDPSAPRLLVATMTPGQPHRMVMSSNLAFVADGGAGLQVIDVTNPTPPPMAGEISTPGYAYAVATAGSLAYVAAVGDGLQIIDVADPRQPILLGSTPCAGVGAVDVTYSRVCFLDFDTDEICLVDGTDPAAPVLAGCVNLPGDLRAVALSGTTACVAAHTAGLQIVDVTDIDNPTLVGSLDLMERAINVATWGHYAYVMANYSMWNYGILYIVEVSNPAVPVVVGSRPMGSGWCGLAADGTYVYLVDQNTLYVIDVIDASAPNVVGELWGFGNATDIAVAGDFAYVNDTNDGIVIIDVSSPMAPRRIQTVPAAGIFHIAIASRAVCTPDDDGLDLHWLQCPGLAATPAPPFAVSELRSYPNPFNPRTRIAFNLASPGSVSLSVYDLRGRLVRQLLHESLAAGEHLMEWNGQDSGGRTVPAGTYFCRLTTPDRTLTRKMNLVK